MFHFAEKQELKKIIEVAKSEERKEDDKPQTPIFEKRSRAADIVIDSAAVLREEAIRIKKNSVSRMSEVSPSVGSASVAPSSQGSVSDISYLLNWEIKWNY